MSFESLGLAPELLQAVRDCGYTDPTPIQEQAIPHLLAGRDLMGCAQTGTGKTAAFALPILHQMRGTPPGHLRALVLVPTRELAIQVGRSVREYGEPLGLRSTAVYGGVPIAPQEMMLRYGVDVLVATPGRLKDHIWRGLIDFRETRFLVLDEADRMLDMGFIDAVREIVALIPRERQTMLFSATLDAAIVRLARDILKDPVRVAVTPSATVADGIEHMMIAVPSGSKKNAFLELIRRHKMFRTLVFTRTRRGASRLAIDLKRDGYRVSSIHSDKTQSQRLDALEAFREGKIDFLVATDIAARGLDVEGISHVVNFDLPRNAEDYVHRIGRTARAGNSGVAISLVGPEDDSSVRSIERLIGHGLREDTGSGTTLHAEYARRPELVRPAETGRRSATGRRVETGRSVETGRRDSARPALAQVSRAGASLAVAVRESAMPNPARSRSASAGSALQGDARREDSVRRENPARRESSIQSVRRSDGHRTDREPAERSPQTRGGQEGDARFAPRARTDTPQPQHRRRGPAPSRVPARDALPGPRRAAEMAPSRGYTPKEGPLQRVLSRLGFRQPR